MFKNGRLSIFSRSRSRSRSREPCGDRSRLPGVPEAKSSTATGGITSSTFAPVPNPTTNVAATTTITTTTTTATTLNITAATGPAPKKTSKKVPKPDPIFPGKLDLTVVYDPPSRNLDIVFVHGLGGGSRKSWSYNKDPERFWPLWLHGIPALEKARVATFGYDAGIVVRQGTTQANVESFGKHLLHCLNQYGVKDDKYGNTPIIFICHSMGGLVTKMACVKGDRDPSMKHLMNKICGIIFLGTPHRGSSQAKKLSRMLNLTGIGVSEKVYIHDITINSGLLQMLNDDFRHLAPRIQLFSFYENLPTGIGFIELMIVEQFSAILGYPEEGSAPLFANHHLVCKFASPQDPSFVTVTNTLVSMIEKIPEYVSATPSAEVKKYMEEIYAYLLSPDITSTETDFYTAQSKRLDADSCKWLAQKPWFNDWLDRAPQKQSQLIWLNGPPGSGKSVLSACVIDELHKAGRVCSYYFFKNSDEATRSLRTCLLSIAYQISLRDRAVRDEILKLKTTKLRVRTAQLLLIWQKIFVDGVLRMFYRDNTPLFLVIDALDEAMNPMEIFPLLNALRSIPSLRICITSRHSVELAKEFSLLSGKMRVTMHSVTFQDNKADILALVQKNMEGIVLQDDAQEEIIATVVERSEGNFLWVGLVSQQMSMEAFNKPRLMRILDATLPGMDNVYKRIIDEVQELGKKQRDLAYWIMQWTLAAFRPLTVSAVREALLFGPPAENVDDVRHWIEKLCAGILAVGRNGRIQPVHATVKEYFHDSANEFGISAKTHAHIAKCCIQTLLKSSSIAARRRHSISLTRSNEEEEAEGSDEDDGGGYVDRPNGRTALWNYALLWWTEHLAYSSAEDDAELYHSVHTLLQSRKFLECLGEIAEYGDLGVLTRMGANIKQFLEGIDESKVAEAQGGNTLIAKWVVDLCRISAEFGDNFRLFPKLLRKVLVPFSPRMSATFKCFGGRQGGMRVLGHAQQNWDSRLTTITKEGSKSAITSIDATNVLVAAAYQDGGISVWNTVSGSARYTLTLSDNLTGPRLRFNHMGNRLAVCGGKDILITWEGSSGLRNLSIPLKEDYEPMLLEFSQDDELLYCAFRNNKLIAYEAISGKVVVEFDWENIKEQSMVMGRPSMVALDRHRKRIAAAYRGQVGVWDIEAKEFVGSLKLEGTASTRTAQPPICAMDWSTISDELFVSSQAGTLVKWHPEQDTYVYAPQDAFIVDMKCSPDGKLLGAGNSSGQMSFWAAESMELVFQDEEDEEGIRKLCITPDGKRVIDSRGTYCNVWQPEILLQGLDVFQKTKAPANKAPLHSLNLAASGVVTFMVLSPCGRLFLVAADDGSVYLYSRGTGKKLKKLYKHPMEVLAVAWAPDGKMVASAHNSKVVVYRLDITEAVRDTERYGLWNSGGEESDISDSGLQARDERIIIGAVKVVVTVNCMGPTSSLLINKDGGLLAIRGRNREYLVKIPTAAAKAVINVPKATESARLRMHNGRLIQHPKNDDSFFLISPTGVRELGWSEVSASTAEGPLVISPGAGKVAAAIDSNITEDQWAAVKEAVISVAEDGSVYLCASIKTSDSERPTDIWVWKLGQDGSTSKRTDREMRLGNILPDAMINALLGLNGGEMYFLDARGWICSVSLAEVLAEGGGGVKWKMWFFVPLGYVTPNFAYSAGARMAVWGGHLVIARKAEVAIMKRGFRGEPVVINEEGGVAGEA